MKLFIALLLTIVFHLPDTALAGSRYSVSYDDDGLTPQQRIRKVNRDIEKRPLTKKQIRAAEESQTSDEAAEQKSLTAEEIEAIIDKKNGELVKQLKPETTKAKSVPAVPQADNSAFGKVGGIGTVGGGGIGTVGGAITTTLPKK